MQRLEEETTQDHLPARMEDGDQEDDRSMEFGDDEDGNSSVGGSQSSGGTSGKSGSTNCKVKKEIAHIEKYSQSETTQVNRWRLCVIISILVVGAFVSVFSYVILQKEETASTEDAFVAFSSTLDDAFHFRVKSIFEANRALSRDITTSALEHKEHFPYFCVPSFEAKANAARRHAGFEAVIFAPIANNEAQWLEFAQTSRSWLDDSKVWYDILEPGQNRSLEPMTPLLPEMVWSYNDDGTLSERKDRGIFVPSLHTSPPPISNGQIYQNVDLFSHSEFRSVTVASVKSSDAVFSRFDTAFAHESDRILGAEQHQVVHDKFHPTTSLQTTVHPHSIAVQPVYLFNGVEGSKNKIVGYLLSIISWDYFLSELLPDNVVGMVAVLKNSCNQTKTYQLNGKEALFMGDDDHHDASFNDLKRTIDFSENYLNATLTSTIEGHCQIFVEVYPSTTFNQSYDTNIPIIFPVIIAFLFVAMATIFAFYDKSVQHRNRKVVDAAARSSAIVTSLFPTTVRDRLMEEENGTKKKGLKQEMFPGRNSLDNTSGMNQPADNSKPIADLFLDCTVFFADIVGFTSWSSVRDPTQVFTLLEAVYNSFDSIARKRKVFKVETIGDCYVAVCGLPELDPDHALTMTRFAKDCMYKMWTLSRQLEETLGPDTSELTMRMGLHSGPVTAGVLRGERSRFQLFGDTVNTASRMESTGFANRIQVSETTANLLIAAGKSNWVTPREDKVNAKGKGMMQTYFIELQVKGGSSIGVASNHGKESSVHEGEAATLTLPTPQLAVAAKKNRLIEWSADVLLKYLEEIVKQRNVDASHQKQQRAYEDLLRNSTNDQYMVLDEVQEVIDFPAHVPLSDNGRDVVLDSDIGNQIRDYLNHIVALYPDHAFHNFEHAAHVTMSVIKLLTRIQGDKTYGITSDPLTQFSCVLSALIHDVGHPGVPNARLVVENTPLAVQYKEKSMAEQSAVDLSWHLLMREEYSKLRAAIYVDEVEMRRFRQLLVNSVIATDIADPEQRAWRDQRWKRAFHSADDEILSVAINRKATIVIEHVIQASDVSHTMQHWHIYRKWNERYFQECCRAHEMGRADRDPSQYWYEGELGFFDHYILPLARKLKECGVFGVSSDEYLTYATQNREEWRTRGQEIVQEMMANYEHWKVKAGFSDPVRLEC